jgi:hypothetical protein
LENKEYCVLDKDKTMDNVQKHNIVTNITELFKVAEDIQAIYFFAEIQTGDR